MGQKHSAASTRSHNNSQQFSPSPRNSSRLSKALSANKSDFSLKLASPGSSDFPMNKKQSRKLSDLEEEGSQSSPDDCFQIASASPLSLYKYCSPQTVTSFTSILGLKADSTSRFEKLESNLACNSNKTLEGGPSSTNST